MHNTQELTQLTRNEAKHLEYQLDPSLFIGYRQDYIVTSIEEIEIKAGAQIGDLAIVCDTHPQDTNIDKNSSFKMLPNFRGVYCSTLGLIRCYFFHPNSSETSLTS